MIDMVSGFFLVKGQNAIAAWFYLAVPTNPVVNPDVVDDQFSWKFCLGVGDTRKIAAHGDIHYQIERLIKWRGPWV